jgi:outer membrane biosynthesis protein TonB
MPRLSVLLLAPGLAAAAISLASCGGEAAKLLPGETAREITANLDTVKQLADEGDCVGAESAAGQVSEQIEELSGIDAKLKRALEEGAARLNEVIASCEEASSEAVAPTEAEPEAEEEEKEESNKKKKQQQQQQESKSKQEETTTAPEPETTPQPTTPTQPPSSNEGGEGGPGSGEEAEENPSGGVGPGSAAK